MIAAGEKITFVRTSVKGGTVSISAKDGWMVEYGPTYSTVKMKNGRTVDVLTDCVRRADEQNALTEAVLRGIEDRR